jgi:predicted nucleotidyltransferase
MGFERLIAENRGEIRRIAARHGVRRISLFGSFARGDPKPQSDVDFLIEVDGPTTPWFPGGLVAELEELLGRHVDVVERNACHESLRRRVLDEAIPL